jgi:hypothetical protein
MYLPPSPQSPRRTGSGFARVRHAYLTQTFFRTGYLERRPHDSRNSRFWTVHHLPQKKEPDLLTRRAHPGSRPAESVDRTSPCHVCPVKPWQARKRRRGAHNEAVRNAAPENACRLGPDWFAVDAQAAQVPRVWQCSQRRLSEHASGSLMETTVTRRKQFQKQL